MSKVDRRDQFRFAYPVKDRPAIDIKGQKYPIIDISSHGIRFSIEGKEHDEDLWEPELLIRGSFKFFCGTSYKVQGRVLYIVNNYVVILLDTPIPLKIINDEQRFILQKYGHAIS